MSLDLEVLPKGSPGQTGLFLVQELGEVLALTLRGTVAPARVACCSATRRTLGT